MKIFNSLLMVGLLAVFTAGCGDKSSSSNTPSTNAAMDYGNTLVNAKKTADKTIDVSYINQALQLYNTQEGHYPKTLSELVPNYVSTLPPAPLGFTLEYDATKGEAKMTAQ